MHFHQVPWEVLKTAAFGLGFQHLLRDLANVNAWKTMFDPYIIWNNISSINKRAVIISLGLIISSIGRGQK